MACIYHQTHLPRCSCCSSCSSFQIRCPCPCPSCPSAFSDSLLQAMASGVFLSSPTPQCDCGLFSHHPAMEQQQHRCGKQQRFHQQEAHHSDISFLLSRVEAMESALRKLHSSSSSSSSFRCPPGSLRDAAARTIQFHFRAFLVRRSQTLRQLKDLALVKSSFSSIKLSFFNGNRVDIEALSLKIMDLLLILDTVQGSDPMIRETKRSISRDLAHFLELIDRKRDKLFSKSMSNSKFNKNICESKVMGSKQGKCGRDQKEMTENLISRVERLRGLSRNCENDEEDIELEGFNHGSEEENEEYYRNRGTLRHNIKPQSEVKRVVRFAENENLSTVNPDESCSDECDCSDDQAQLVENLCNEVEEIKGFSTLEPEDTINRGRNTARNVSNEGNSRIRSQHRVPGEGFVFSAPLPVKMEGKADLVKKRKALKIRS